MKRSGELRIGISGWRYPGWRGKFYPKGLAQRRELEYASDAFNSVEINGSFYSLQRPSSYQRWHSETPDDFLFAVKGGRFITHMKKLRDIERDEPAFSKDSLPKKNVHWVKPKLVGQVGFTEWTGDGKLRHPRFKGLRRDKKPKDVVREKQ